MGLFFRKNTNICDINKLDFTLFDKNIYTSFQENIRKLNNLLHDYKNIAIYGSGAHGNTVITFIDNSEKIKKCFDLDIRKQGMYLQNSSIMIQDLNIENFKDLEAIIIATPLYKEEIIRSLREKGYKGILSPQKKS